MKTKEVISQIRKEQSNLEEEISALIGDFCDKTGIKAFDMEISLNGYDMRSKPLVNVNSKI